MKKLLLFSLLLISIGVKAQIKDTTKSAFADTTKHFIKSDGTLVAYSNSFSESDFNKISTIKITIAKPLITIHAINNKFDCSDGAIITIDPKAKIIRKGKYILIVKP